MSGPYFNALARPVLTVADAAALRAVDSNLFVEGELADLGSNGSRFEWAPASVVPDDGVEVIKPADVGGAGRWLLAVELLSAMTVAEFLGFGTGPLPAWGDIRTSPTFDVAGAKVAGVSDAGLISWRGAVGGGTLMVGSTDLSSFSLISDGVIDFQTPSVTATGNPTWDLGTGQVSTDLLDVDTALTIDAAGYLGFGTAPGTGATAMASAGTIRTPKAFSWKMRRTGDASDADVISSLDGESLAIGSLTTLANSITIDSFTAVNLRSAVGGQVSLGADGMRLDYYKLCWHQAPISGAPLLTQKDLLAAGAAQKFTIKAQKSPAGGGSVGGALALLGGAGTTPGWLELGVEGNAFATTGVVRVAEEFSLIARNTTNTGDHVLISVDASDNNYFGNTSTGNGAYFSGCTLLQLRNAYHVILESGSGYIEFTPADVRWDKAVVNATLSYETDTVAGVVGKKLTLRGQRATGGGGAVGGPLALLAGDGDGFANWGYIELGVYGDTFATQGNVRMGREAILTYRPSGLAVNEYLFRGDIAGNVIFGDAGVTPTTYFDAVTNHLLRIAGNTRVEVLNTLIEFTLPTLRFKANQSNPTLTQDALTTVGGTANKLTIQAQRETGGGASVGGGLALLAGSGATPGAVEVGVYGDVFPTSGTLRTAFATEWHSKDAAGNNQAIFYQRNLAGSTAIYFGDPTNTDYCVFQTAGEFDFMVGATVALFATTTWLATNANYLGWGQAVASPYLIQQTDGSVGGVRPTLRFSSQDSTVAGSTGANLEIRPGHGVAVHGQLKLQDAAASDRITIDASSNITLSAASYAYLTTGGLNRAYVGSDGLTVNQGRLLFDSGCTTPEFYQYTDTSAGGVRPTMLIHAQDTTLGVPAAGADLHLRPGHGAGIHGELELQDADGLVGIKIGADRSINIQDSLSSLYLNNAAGTATLNGANFLTLSSDSTLSISATDITEHADTIELHANGGDITVNASTISFLVADIQRMGVTQHGATVGSIYANARLLGSFAQAGYQFAATGDGQAITVMVYRTSTDNTSVELTTDGAAPGASNRVTVPSGRMFRYTLEGATKCTAGTNANASAGWTSFGLISNIGGTTALVGTNPRRNLLNDGTWSAATFTPCFYTAALSTATMTPAADNTNDSLAISFVGVTGASANSFRTEARLTLVEIAS